MTLLREIQQGAVNADTDIGTVLRKCLVLAARLRNEELKRWVERELNGYPDEEELPPYRLIETSAFGFFSGPFGSQINNAPIPPRAIPKEYRKRLFRAHLREPISVYANIAAVGGNQTLTSQWPADILPIVGRQILANMNCLSAWQELTTSNLLGVVETVRNRVLSFALEIEAAAPEAAHVASPETSLSGSQVSQLFHTYIMGNVSNWSAGGTNLTQLSIDVQAGDLNKLLSVVRSLGIEEKEVQALEEAVTDSEPPPQKGTFGAKIARWLGQVLTKSAEGVYKVGTEVAADVLAKALNGYYGLK